MPTKFPNGLNSFVKEGALAELDMTNPTRYNMLYEDFVDFDFGDYPADSDGVALQYAVTLDAELDYDVSFANSNLVLTTEGGDTEGGQFRLNASPFALASTKKAFFECKLTVTQTTIASNSLFIGLAKNQTGTNFIDDGGTAFAVDDAWGFSKVTATAAMAATVRDNDVASTSSAVHTLVTATAVKLGLYYDGTQTEVYVNDVKVATNTGVHPTGDAMTLMIHVKSQAVEATVAAIDYVFVAVEK